MYLHKSSEKDLILYDNGKFTKLNRNDLKKTIYSKTQTLFNNQDFNNLLSAFDDIISIQIYNDLVLRLNLTNQKCIFLYDKQIYDLIFDAAIFAALQ